MAANILIVGCGAIGGLFAAALSRVARVIAFDSSVEHVEAINTHGLRVIGRNQGTAHLRATDNPAALSGVAFDAVMFLVKSKTTSIAMAQLRPALDGNPA